MKIKNISYSESVELINDIGLKKWIKSSMEIDIEDDLEIDKATQIAKDYVSKTILNVKISLNKPEPLPELQTHTKSSKETQIDNIIKDINTCTELKVLEAYKLLAKNTPEIEQVYNKKLNELTNK